MLFKIKFFKAIPVDNKALECLFEEHGEDVGKALKNSLASDYDHNGRSYLWSVVVANRISSSSFCILSTISGCCLQRITDSMLLYSTEWMMSGYKCVVTIILQDVNASFGHDQVTLSLLSRKILVNDSGYYQGYVSGCDYFHQQINGSLPN